jgi:integrase
MVLTVKRVARLIGRGEPSKTNDGRGLYLVVESTTSANWTLRYQIDYRKRWMGLGSAFDFPLAEARDRAQAARRKLADGIDPLVIRQTERTAAIAQAAKRLTFAEAATGWFEAQRPKWSSPKNASNIRDALSKWVIPLMGSLDVATIETASVMKVLQQPVEKEGPLWTTRTSTADKVRNSLQQILDWATVAGHRPPGPNPARWKGHLAVLLPPPAKVTPVKNLPAMPYTAVPALMVKLTAHEGVGALALRFLIMTAARISEAAGATWGEIDLAKAEWRIPASRMKARREHVVPLAPEAIKLLKGLPTEDGNNFVFLGAGSGEGVSDSALRMTLRRMGHRDIVAHGFRSSFSTWAHERTAHSNHVIELSLAHTVGNEVERAYRRSDLFEKRRRLMMEWAKFCTSPTGAKSDKNVVEIGLAR